MTLLNERYELLDRLGSGAQAHTWTANDRVSGDVVVVKQLRIAEMADWKAHELFGRETEALQNLDHPHVPRFVDAFVDIDGSDPSAYLVMQYIDGTDLRAGLVGGSTWSAEELERMLTEVLDVLEYLHGRQPTIVHRDIKPSNIIRRPDGSFAVADFGAIGVGPTSTLALSLGVGVLVVVGGLAWQASKGRGNGYLEIDIGRGYRIRSPDTHNKLRAGHFDAIIGPDRGYGAQAKSFYLATRDGMFEIGTHCSEEEQDWLIDEVGDFIQQQRGR